MTTPNKSALKKTPKTPSKNHKRNRILLLLVGVVGLVLTIVGLLGVFIWRFEENTEDAYVSGNTVVITTQIPGTPVKLFVQDTDCVKEGQVLVNLDVTDYQEAFNKEKAALILAVQQVKKIWEEVKVASAEMTLQEAQLTKAQSDYENRSRLIDIQAVSKEEWEHIQTELAMAEASVKVAQSKKDSALTALGQTKLEEHPLIQQAKVRLREAYLDLQRCTIEAPVSGFIAQKHVQLGETVQPQTPLMSIVPLDQLWVDAHFLETQLKNIRLGQPAAIKADIYGSQVTYQGTVQGIAAGTGSVFSLLPPQNATGNWIKVVQRVSVRIRLNDPLLLKQFPLRLGLSVKVDVDTHDRSGKMLTEAVPDQVIASTSVYTVALEEFEQSMNQIVQSHLSSSL
jgi:membrane fusion protein (multidrug efflux system)